MIEHALVTGDVDLVRRLNRDVVLGLIGSKVPFRERPLLGAQEPSHPSNGVLYR